MSNLDHITGTAFVGATEAQYLTWLDEAAGEQKRLEEQRDRLLRYVRARQWMIEGWVAELDDEEFARRSHEADEAWEALRGAGDLDVDGSKSRE